MAHLRIDTNTTMDIGAGGNDKDAWGRTSTHPGAPPQVSQPLGGGYGVIIAGGVLVRGACCIPHCLWGGLGQDREREGSLYEVITAI